MAVPVSTSGSTVSPLTTLRQRIDAELPDLGGELRDRGVLGAGHDERDLVGQRIEADEDDVLGRDAGVGDGRRRHPTAGGPQAA